jgi:hypothetical protein
VVFDVNGTTPLSTAFLGQVYTSPTAGGTYVAVGAALHFDNGGNPGQIDLPATGATLVSPNVAANTTGFYELKAWTATAGTTFEQASTVAGAHVGSSTATSVVFGNIAAGSPPGPDVSGFASFHLTTVVPEPSTLALGIVGVAGLLALRRRQ